MIKVRIKQTNKLLIETDEDQDEKKKKKKKIKMWLIKIEK